MTKLVDARGLSCPQPVILARKAINDGDFPVELLVETATSRDNVCRMTERYGCTIQVTVLDDDEYKLTIVKA